MSDDKLRNGDEDDLDFADQTDLDSDDLDTSADDDTIGEDDTEDKSVPYSRFKEKNQEAQDWKVKYEAATQANAEPRKGEPVVKGKFSDEQIETVRNLAGTRGLQNEIKKLNDRLEEKEKREQHDQDTNQLKEALSDKELNPHGLSQKVVQAQLLKWGKSNDADKQWLASAPWKFVLKELTEIKGRQEAKKKDSPPKVSIGAEPRTRNPDSYEREEPSYVSPLQEKAALQRDAQAFYESLGGGER